MSDVNIDHIESLAGPLPKGREWERWCEYTQPLSLPERGKADAALAEAYAVIERKHHAVEKLQKREVALEMLAEKWCEHECVAADCNGCVLAARDRKESDE
jgi:hypothetical protein